MTLYRNDRKITRKQAEEWLGKDRLAQRIEDGKADYAEDPNTEITWMDGFRIEFDIR